MPVALKGILGALLLYAASTPFPKGLGVIELVIAGLLVFAFFKPVIRLLRLDGLGHGLMFYALLALPLLGAMVHQNSVSDIVRDFIPLFYLLIPIFLASYKYDASAFVMRIVPYAAALVGLVFSLRELSDWMVLGPLAAGVMRQTEEYLIQSPLVLFASTFFLLQGFRLLFISPFKASVFLLCSVPPLLGFYFVVLRAPLVLSLLVPMLYACLIFRKRRLFILVPALGVISLIYVPVDVEYIFQLFVTKQLNYGDNNKLAELLEISRSVLGQNDSFTLLLGKGVGGVWVSPAVGAEVSYAHSLLGYALLKLGLVGSLMFFIFTFVLIARGAMATWTLKREPEALAIFMSTWPSLFVNIFLEAGFKAFGFGIILAIFFICTRSGGVSIGNPKSQQICGP